MRKKLFILLACFMLMGSLSATIYTEAPNVSYTVCFPTCGFATGYYGYKVLAKIDTYSFSCQYNTSQSDSKILSILNSSKSLMANTSFTGNQSGTIIYHLSAGSSYYVVLSNATGTQNLGYKNSGVSYPRDGTAINWTGSMNNGNDLADGAYGFITCYFNDTMIITGNLTVNASTGGTATGSNSTFAPPSTMPINATANSGYFFSNWTTNCNGTISNLTNKNTTIQVNDNVSCYAQANFFLIPNATLTAPTITPTLAHLNDTLVCNPGVFGSDTENTTSRTWRWYINGVSAATTQNLSPGIFAASDNIQCQENTSGLTYGAYAAANSTNFTNILSVNYISYAKPNTSGFGSALDYSATVMTTATGSSDAFGLMVLSTCFLCFYIVGSRYTQERALVYSAFLTVVVSFLLVSGNFLDAKWLILSIIALLAAIYFANRVG